MLAPSVSATEITTVFDSYYANDLISDELWAKFDGIPIYITVIETDDVEERTSIQRQIELLLSNEYANSVDIITDTQPSQELQISNDLYTISEVSLSSHKSILSNPLFANSLHRIEEAIDSGITVTSINFYVNINPLTETYSVNADADDESYWENYCSTLGTYNGYKFLYLETSYSIETSKVEPGNISPSFNWGTFLTKSLTTAVTMYIDSQIESTGTIRSVISDLLGSVTTP